MYGEVRERGVLHGVPIAGDLGDQQAATFGQACLAVGEAKNTYGTGNFMLINTGTQKVPSKNGLLTTVCYKIGDQATVYALEGAVAVTGSLVQWVRDNLGLIGSAPEIETLAKTVEDNGGAYFVPAFSGLFAPYWRGDARGAIVGLTRYVNKGHLARAVLEATAFQSKELLDAMNADSGVDLTALKVDGGMVAERDPDAVPGRHPRRPGDPAGGRGDHRARCRVRRGPGRRVLAGRGRHPRELGRGQALGAEHGRRPAREATTASGRRPSRRPSTGSTRTTEPRSVPVGGPGVPRPADGAVESADGRTGIIAARVPAALALLVIPPRGPEPEDTVQRYGAGVSEQDLLSAFDNAPIGIAVLTPQGVVTRATRRWAACSTATPPSWSAGRSST